METERTAMGGEERELPGVRIEKQQDGGFVLTDLASGNSVYSGGLDGCIGVYCAVLKYPLEYLIEDLQERYKEQK